jgi:hypothetical protein
MCLVVGRVEVMFASMGALPTVAAYGYTLARRLARKKDVKIRIMAC